METQTLTINVSSEGVSALDLKSALSGGEAEAPGGMEIRVPKPAPGGLAMLDPGTVQILLTLLGGTGAVALAVKGIFQFLNKYIETHNAPLTVKIGSNSLVLPPNVPVEERARMYDEFVSRVSKKPK